MSQWKYGVLRALPAPLCRAVLFRRFIGHWPRLRDPITFSEKVNWRILNDRRPELVWTCDKLEMKEHARRVPLVAVPRTVWVGDDLAELVGVELPSRWVLKPNNGSGRVHFGRGALDAAAVADLLAETRGWLRPWQTVYLREWAYREAAANFFVEEFIDDPAGEVPDDYKVHVFDGVVQWIQVDAGRYAGEGRRRGFFSPEWEPIRVSKRVSGEPPRMERPAHLDRMLAAASEIAAGFDFLRVDFFAPGEQLWFGEVCPYPSSGLTPIHPAEMDVVWGRLWTLPSRNEARGRVPAAPPKAHASSSSSRRNGRRSG